MEEKDNNKKKAILRRLRYAGAALKITLLNVLLYYQPISKANPAKVGQIGCADWLVPQKDILESENYC